MRSLRMKLVMIMVILILALMSVVGAFLINGVGNFYISEFYVQMNQTFSPEFITQLQRIAAQESAAPERMKELLMAQAGLGIDISNRNVFVLDETGGVLASSNGEEAVSMSTNLLTAMNGAVGQESSISSSTMDLAVPIETDTQRYIVYILDAKATVDALTSEVLGIIIKALALGLVICLVLSVLLAQILITPLRALTRGTRQVAAGDFEQRLDAASNDEIGVLTRNFNYMAQVLQDTISEAENERNKLSTLFLHMTDGVVAFSRNGEVIHSNPAAEEMLGRTITAEATYEELFGDLLPLEQVLQAPDYLEEERWEGERFLQLLLAPFDRDRQGGVLVVLHDVTQQRKTQDMQREFVANVSHELRTPLTNIRSYAETLSDSAGELPPATEKKFLGVILNESDRMTHIVQDLLTLSRFDSGKDELHLVRFPFDVAVQDLYNAVYMEAQRHDHKMKLRLEPDLPAVVADRERVLQVMMNIVSNSIKYTPNGGHILVSAGREGDRVWMQVDDDGIGIPPKDRPRIFERFYRVDKARSRQSGGTGLGLSIAKEIVDRHEGVLELVDREGPGLSMRMELKIEGPSHV